MATPRHCSRSSTQRSKVIERLPADDSLPILRYFDCRSRAQALRFALADLGIDSRDERIPLDLAAFRAQARHSELGGPFASLPLLVWGELPIAQTLAIASFLERQRPRSAEPSPEESARLEMVVCAAHLDMQLPHSQLLWLPADHPNERLRRATGRLRDLLLEKTHQLEALLQGSEPYFGGAEPAMADYFVFESMTRASAVLGSAFTARLERAPRVQALVSAMHARPAIAALWADGSVPYLVSASPSEPVLRERILSEAAP